MVYNIKDVWFGLKLSFSNFFTLFFINSGLTILAFLIFKINILFVMIYLIISTIIFFIQSVIIYFKNSRYFINVDKNEVVFPKSDIENSVLEILVFAPYWNLMRSKIVQISDIQNIYINAEDEAINLDVTGTFGSCRFIFSTKQKRNEVRNALVNSVEIVTSRSVDTSVNVNV